MNPWLTGGLLGALLGFSLLLVVRRMPFLRRPSVDDRIAPPNAAAPHSTCSIRNSSTVRSIPARASRLRIDVAPPSSRSSRDAPPRSDGSNSRNTA